MTTQQPSTEITGVILAGGEGRRMGGQDKGWVDYQGQPLIRHVVARLQPQVDELLINANRNTASYEALGHPVVSDVEQGFQGPLMGILTGLQAASHDWVVFVPCDGPFLPAGLVTSLLQAARQENRQLAVASDGQWLQPVVVLIHRSLRENLLQAMQAGERKPDRWYAQVGIAQAVFDPASLRNFNRLEEMG